MLHRLDLEIATKAGTGFLGLTAVQEVVSQNPSSIIYMIVSLATIIGQIWLAKIKSKSDDRQIKTDNRPVNRPIDTEKRHDADTIKQSEK